MELDRAVVKDTLNILGMAEIANIPKNLERGDYKLKLIITGFNKKEDRYDIKEIVYL